MENNGAPNTLQDTGGFLVEDRQEGEPVYYDCSNRIPGSHSWNADKKLALRFHRAIDADRFIEKFRLTGVTVVPYGQ